MKFEKEFDDDQIEQLRAMAAMGLTMPKIATIMGISKSTLERMSKHRDNVREALEKGGAEGSAAVIQAAFDMAISGKSPYMTRFWLKVREGWRETTHIALQGDGGGDRAIEDMSRDEREERIEKLLKIREKLTIDVTPTKEKK